MTSPLDTLHAAAALAGIAGATLCGAQPPARYGQGLTLRDLRRVEQVRGDAGGLATSLARGPASLALPNDFAGVYQVPLDADTPYAGWYARCAGALIAVFPRADYKPSAGGMTAVVPANTRFFLGSIPLNSRPAEAKPTGVAARLDLRYTGDEPARPLAPDAPAPATVETAPDAAGVSAAVARIFNDPVYRANRVRELLERASR